MGGLAGLETSPPPLGKIAIIGLGLIGGSIGLALRGKVGSVVGYDPQTSRRALELGAIDGEAASARECISNADVVLLCAPLQSTLTVLNDISAVLPKTAIVSDVGSLKADIVTGAEGLLPGRFIGGHPMAGSDSNGIEAANANLFLDAPWFLTPTVQTEAVALQQVENVVRACGARPRICDPSEHDHIVAVLSHLPHLLAYGLANTAAELVSAEWRDVAAGSFRDGTRVAGSHPDLWTHVFQKNQTSILASLDVFDAWTSALRQAMTRGDDREIGALLSAAQEAKRTFRG